MRYYFRNEVFGDGADANADAYMKWVVRGENAADVANATLLQRSDLTEDDQARE